MSTESCANVNEYVRAVCRAFLYMCVCCSMAKLVLLRRAPFLRDGYLFEILLKKGVLPLL